LTVFVPLRSLIFAGGARLFMELTMKVKLFPGVLVASMALSGAVALQTQAQAKPPVPSSSAATVFRCVSQGRGYATVAERGGMRSAPMITWESEIFGPEYTPEVRCNTVSQNLTRAVAMNGGSLRNLLLTTGQLNGQTVICYINVGAPRCNRSNMLFTLNPENATDPGAALASLLRFSIGASGGPLRQDAADGSEGPTVKMEALVEKAFAAGGNQDSTVSPAPSESVTPSNVPQPETGGTPSVW
jgi:hypothetical protein